MAPTRKVSRSKQNSESTACSVDETSEQTEAIIEQSEQALKIMAVTNDVDKSDLSVDETTSAEDKDEQDDETKNKQTRRGSTRSRRSTASSVQIENDLNDATASDSGESNAKRTKTASNELELASSPSTRNKSSSCGNPRQASLEKKESDIKLRRRDKIKGTERYSPEIHEPVRRSKRPLSFPSTSTSLNKYINFEAFEEDQSISSQSSQNNNSAINTLSSNNQQLLPTKKMLLKRSANALSDDQNSTSTNESKTFLVNLKQEENELILVMRDGRTLKIEKPATPANKRQKTSKSSDNDYEMEDDDVDVDEEDDDDDLDYEEEGKGARLNKRKTKAKNSKLKAGKLQDSNNDSDEISLPSHEKKVQATGIKMTKQIRKATKQQLMSSKLGDETRTTRITTPTGTGKTVTFITTPKSVTVTPANTYAKGANTYVKRNYGSNAKYLNEIPDLNECTLEEVVPDFAILPDRLLLVNSDLPLKHSLNSKDISEDVFLFTQIISAMADGFKCLLCASVPSVTNTTISPAPVSSKLPSHTFKDEDELVEHYKQFHELEIEQQSAKFSEDTVFVCLPKSIISQMNSEESGSSLILDAPCQYCGDEQKLATVEDMKEHYKDAHSKEIKIVEQEEILEMYEVLFCSICQATSKDFKLHYAHMKEEHKMQIYICKQCPFFSKVPQRLVTHYRAKHLMSNKNQNLQCSFCNGILIGTDRMNKHIMTSHCVQTGEKEYSCMLCLQPCEKSDQLLAHSYQCQRKFNESLTITHKQEKLNEQQAIEQANALAARTVERKFECFLCERSFASENTLALHLNHVHTKWASTVIVNDTLLMVQHKDGKTDLMPNKIAKNEKQLPSINDLPKPKELEEIGAKTRYGYYCAKCDCVIKIYQLYYLHMHNFHHMSKQFECKISSCKRTFKTYELFKDHIAQSKHPQKSVIEEPLLSIACHNCDSYFIDNKDIETHLLSDDHYNKVSKNTDRSGMKSEARNYKCKICHTWFGLLDSYVYHMENESHKHGCPHCGLHFALPSSRRTHIQSAHSDRADICELCSEKQGTKERLFAHLVTHNLVFECNRCMRKFYQREQLNNHMETHGDPLNCPWPKCERKVSRTALSNHIRQHKVETSLKCYACDKLFQNKNQLLAHVEVHNMAEENAKMIIASATNSTSKIGKVNQIISNHQTPNKPKIGQLQLTTTSNSASPQPVETTLISITTSSGGAHKQRTYGNRSLSNSANKLNNSNSLTHNKSLQHSQFTPIANKYQTEKAGSNATSSKIACFTCNQMFTNHKELSEHKCSVNKPVVTITKENKQIDLIETTPNEALVFTTTLGDKINGEQCLIMTDNNQETGGIKQFILQTAHQPMSNANEDAIKNKKKITIPASTPTNATHNRFMESNKKTYDFHNRAKKNYSLKNKQTNQSTANNQQTQLLLNDGTTAFKNIAAGEESNVSTVQHPQQIFIETQSSNGQPTQLILTDANQLAALNSNIELDSNTVSTIQALIQENQLIHGNEVLQIPLDQHQIIVQEEPINESQTNAEQQAITTAAAGTLIDQQQTIQIATTPADQAQQQILASEQQIPDTNQYIMIQQPDGQCVQICIPEGMDVDEVIKSLNFTWQGGEEVAAGTQIATDQTTDAQFLDTRQILEQQQMIADQQNQLLAAEQSQQQQILTDQQIQQLNLDPTTVEQLQSGEQQVIYLPVNEDGTPAIPLDEQSLAMLTNGGEIPIIVSSSN